MFVFPDPTAIVVHADATYAASEQIAITVMPVGDSITLGVQDSVETDSQAGYRQMFYEQLGAAGYRVRMVGAQVDGPANFREKQHNGWPGKQIGYIADAIGGWLNSYAPDIILLNIGVNNLLQPVNHDGSTKTDADRQNAPNELAALLDQIYAADPRVWVLVMPVTPVKASVYPNGPYWVTRLNDGLRVFVAQKIALGYRVRLAEIYPGITEQGSDGVHPGTPGYTTMANVFADTLLSVYDDWACVPRTDVTVTATKTASGVLTAVVTAPTPIESIVLESVRNATVAFAGGGASATAPRRYVPPSPTSSVSIAFNRQSASSDVVGRLVMIDDCGPWPATIVAGTGAL